MTMFIMAHHCQVWEWFLENGDVSSQDPSCTILKAPGTIFQSAHYWMNGQLLKGETSQKELINLTRSKAEKTCSNATAAIPQRAKCKHEMEMFSLSVQALSVLLSHAHTTISSKSSANRWHTLLHTFPADTQDLFTKTLQGTKADTLTCRKRCQDIWLMVCGQLEGNFKCQYASRIYYFKCKGL